MRLRVCRRASAAQRKPTRPARLWPRRPTCRTDKSTCSADRFAAATTWPSYERRIGTLGADSLRLLTCGGRARVGEKVVVLRTARHLDFLLNAVETWLEVTNGDRSMWYELGIGRKVAEWLNKAAVDDPSLHSRSHPSRSRIDAILGPLVSLGVSEAHELEVRIQAQANSQAPRW